MYCVRELINQKEKFMASTVPYAGIMRICMYKATSGMPQQAQHQHHWKGKENNNGSTPVFRAKKQLGGSFNSKKKDQ